MSSLVVLAIPVREGDDDKGKKRDPAEVDIVIKKDNPEPPAREAAWVFNGWRRHW